MRKRYTLLALLATFTILVPVAIVSQAQKPIQTAPPALVSVALNADTIFSLVNQERTSRGLTPLVRDARLDAVAQLRSDDMATRNYFAHRDPITNENMVKALDYCTFTSENISTVYNPGGDNNTDVVNGWMGSKAHHDAMLLATYSLSGIAITGDKIVQTFCIAN